MQQEGTQGELVHQEITDAILGAAIKVHQQLGPGLLESAYEACLCFELDRRKVRCQRQVPLPVVYDGLRVDCGYRLDLVVEEKVIVEVKSAAEFAPIHEAQLHTYLRLSGKRVGLLINFNVRRLRDGIIRRVL